MISNWHAKKNIALKKLRSKEKLFVALEKQDIFG